MPLPVHRHPTNPLNAVDAMILPSGSVPNTRAFGIVVIVIPPAGVPSKMIPVVERLLPSAVRIICWIYSVAFTNDELILNACVAKMTHDAPRKNIVRYLKMFVLVLVLESKLFCLNAIAL